MTDECHVKWDNQHRCHFIPDGHRGRRHECHCGAIKLPLDPKVKESENVTRLPSPMQDLCCLKSLMDTPYAQIEGFDCMECQSRYTPIRGSYPPSYSKTSLEKEL